MICEFCYKEHDGTYGSGRFCSEKCARSFSSNHFKEKLKIAKCISCGKEIQIPLKASSKVCKCLECKTKFKHKCSICGTEFEGAKHKSICNNPFCQKHGIQQFRTLIKYFHFDSSKLGTEEVQKEFYRVRDVLEDLYWNQHVSTAELCKMFNYPRPANIGKVFSYLGISTKTLSYATKENILEGRFNVPSCNTFHKEWHTTWNKKKVYLRSSYELDFAKELDEKKIDYEVETLRIVYYDSQQQKMRVAIPDFYIPKENLIVEIKSSFTLDERNMQDKKKSYLEQGFNFKLVCDHEEMIF